MLLDVCFFVRIQKAGSDLAVILEATPHHVYIVTIAHKYLEIGPIGRFFVACGELYIITVTLDIHLRPAEGPCRVAIMWKESPEQTETNDECRDS